MNIAALTTVEPEIAAKPADATVVAMNSPPRTASSQRFTAAYSSEMMPDAEAIAPISTNIGMTAKAYSLAVA